jgi:hypothetical protein
MTKTKKLSAVSIILLIIAVIMLLIGGIGGARAALSTPSNTHTATLQMQEVDISLIENKTTEVPNDGALLANLIPEKETLKIGKTYDEFLQVRNNGADAYVRVILYKYWQNKDGKNVDLDPGLIELGLGDAADWKVDTEASTPERTVLYYTKPLEAGATSSEVLKSVTLKGELATMVTQTQETVTEGDKTYTTVTNTYKYDGLEFGLKAEVDAVQTHNAEDAIKSAWGKEMSEVIG